MSRADRTSLAEEALGRVAGDASRGATGGGEGRHRELDAIRGLAALAVVLFHYTVRYAELFPGPTAPLRVAFGSFGVEVFFGISGFVILMTLERSSTARDFLVSRFSRLYPAYWICIAITMTVMQIFPLPGRGASWPQALANLSMWQELWQVPHVDGVYWSLQVELIFYGLMLLMFLAGLLHRARGALLAWLVVSVVTQLVSALLGRPAPYVAERFLLLDHSAFFAIGAAAYLDFRTRKLSRATWSIFALALASAWLWTGVNGLWVALGMTVLFALLIHRKLDMLDNRPLVWLGTISYPLYLLHQNIGYVVIRSLTSAGVAYVLAMVVAIMLSFALASAVTYAVERPALKWIRSRLRPRVRVLDATARASRIPP
jgi:peptidoglycan/LPS O-acetylase OafA/YrhL